MRLPACNAVRAAVVVLATTLLTSASVACTGADLAEPNEGRLVSSPPPVTSADSYVFTDAAGIEARLTIEGEGAVLSVTNDTGAQLPAPGIFVLDARDGNKTPWTVIDARPVAEGESVWQVERPAVPDAKHLGLVVMLFGGEDYGAFVPPQPGAAP